MLHLPNRCRLFSSQRGHSVPVREQRRLAKQRQTGLDNETTFKNPETGALLSRKPGKAVRRVMVEEMNPSSSLRIESLSD